MTSYYYLIKPFNIFAARFAPYFVILLEGRQPICVVCLVWHKSASQIFLKRFIR